MGTAGFIGLDQCSADVRRLQERMHFVLSRLARRTIHHKRHHPVPTDVFCGVVLSLDMSQAFDSVPRQHIQAALLDAGVAASDVQLSYHAMASRLEISHAAWSYQPEHPNAAWRTPGLRTLAAPLELLHVLCGKASS